MRKKRVIAVLAAGVLLAGTMTVPASAKSSSEIQKEINAYESELSESQTQSEALSEQIVDLQKEVGTLTSEIEALNIQMQEYQDGMSLRIKYFYEESPANAILDAFLGAESFSELVSQLDYIQSLYDYDSDQMNQYEDLIGQSALKKTELNDNIEEMAALLDEQETLQSQLSSAISGKQTELEQAKEAEAEAARQAQKRAAAAAAKEAAEKAEKAEAEELAEAAKETVSEASEESSDDSDKSSSKDNSKNASKGSSKDTSKDSSKDTSKDSSKDTSKDSSKGSSGSSSGSSKNNSTSLVTYNGNVAKISMYPNDSGGVLTKSKGVVYYNGHKETWYSQRVLPGGGLNIPGRHVDENGLIRDGSGYICVASSDLPKGTLIETSLGMGKVYDSGCASGTIDIYTDW